MAWKSADEEHYVELLVTSQAIVARCDCGAESQPSIMSSDPTRWALKHVSQKHAIGDSTGECDANAHRACPWYIWTDDAQPAFCTCECHGEAR